jgi:hypothetical protein
MPYEKAPAGAFFIDFDSGLAVYLLFLNPFTCSGLFSAGTLS